MANFASFVENKAPATATSPVGQPQNFMQPGATAPAPPPPGGAQNFATAGAAAPPAPTPAAAPAPSPAAPAASAPASAGPDPFAAMGGGTNVNGNWIPNNNPAEIARAQAAAGITPGASSPSPASPGGQPNATPQTIQQAFQNSLSSLLTGPTPDQAGQNLGSTPEAQAFRNAQQRSFDRQAQQLAEENAVGGGNVNNPGLDMATRGLRQQQGEAEGQFMAGLSSQRIADRRNELMSALGMAQAMGDNAEARRLQLQLGQMDADTRNNATASQERLGRSDLDLRKTLGLGDLDLRRYGINVGSAYDYDALQQQANQSALEALF